MFKVLLSDSDMEYGNALAKAISNLHIEFEVKIISLDEDNLNKCKSFIDQFDLFILGGYNDKNESLKEINMEKNKVVFLTEYQVETIKKQAEHQINCFWYLYKYVEISEIITALNYIIGFVSGKKSFMRKSLHTSIIGFCGMSGGVGKSVISIGTCRELSRYHDKKILYLSFEEIPTTELYFKCNLQNRNIGDYLYFLLERHNEILCSHLDGFISTDEFGVDYFPSSNVINDLNLLSKNELDYLIKILSDSCRYDFIIFDLNNNLSEETLFVMEQCNKIILVQNNSFASVYKNEKMLNYINNVNPSKLTDIFCITNEIEDLENALLKNKELEINRLKNIYIEKDESSFHLLDNYLEININHSFGVGIKKVSDEILSLGNKT